MKTGKLFELFIEPIEKALRAVGSFINQCPSQEEIDGLRRSPLFNNPYSKKNKTVFEMTDRQDHQRGLRAKGIANPGTRIFNKPRK